MRKATITTTIQPSILDATEPEAVVEASVDGVEVYKGRTYGFGSVKAKQKEALKALRRYVSEGAVQITKTRQEFYVDGADLVPVAKVQV